MKFKYILWVAFTYCSLTLAAYAQANNEQKKAEEALAPVSNRPMVVKLFDVKHRKPVDLVSAVSVYRSGFQPSQMSFNPELRTISVKDFPENVAAIEEALKRLDVPFPPPPPSPPPISLEFQLHLIAASMTAGEKTTFPKSIENVLPQLQASLKFTSYRYINTAIHRVNNDGRLEASGVNSSLFPVPSGVINTNETPAFSQYSVGNLRLITDTTGKEFVQIRNFKFGVSVPLRLSGNNVQYKDIGINTELTLREGELAVVGTANASVADEAIIVVVSVKKVR